MLRSNQLIVQRVPIDALRLASPAVRTHAPKQRAKIRRLLGAFGQVSPALVGPDGTIIDHQMVWEEMKALGHLMIDVIVVEGKSSAELLALRLALNRTAADGGWDSQELQKALNQLVQVDFELDLTGFEPPEIDYTLNLDIPIAKENGADIPSVESAAITTRGTIWQLGPHRVGCGDATDTGFVARVLDGAVATMAFTDPPWNVPVQGSISGKGKHKHREFVQGAGELSDDSFFKFRCALLNVLKNSCSRSALLYVCVDWPHITEMNVAARRCGMPLHNICVWTKTNGRMGGIYRNAHELIPVYLAGDQPSLNNVKRGRHDSNRTNVWNYPSMNAFSRDRNAILGSHPTAKPVALVADALRDVTKRGDVVIDTFLGSGTTLVAADETGRICCGTDLDPLYVDVIVRRWQAATGREAVHAGTGETFNAAKQKTSPQAGPAHG